MSLDPIAFGQALVQTGFFGLSAWLLWERRVERKESHDRTSEILHVVKDNTMVLEHTSEAIKTLTMVVRDLDSDVRRNGHEPALHRQHRRP